MEGKTAFKRNAPLVQAIKDAAVIEKTLASRRSDPDKRKFENPICLSAA